MALFDSILTTLPVLFELLATAVAALADAWSVILEASPYLYLPILVGLVAVWAASSQLYVGPAVRGVLGRLIGSPVVVERRRVSSAFREGPGPHYAFDWVTKKETWWRRLVIWVTRQAYYLCYSLPRFAVTCVGCWVWFDPRAGDFTAAASKRLSLTHYQAGGADALVAAYRWAIAWVKHPFDPSGGIGQMVVVAVVSVVVFAAVLMYVGNKMPTWTRGAMIGLSGIELERRYPEDPGNLYFKYLKGNGRSSEKIARFIYTCHDFCWQLIWFLVFGEFMRFWLLAFSDFVS